ncbi:hypothetical protein [Flavobacterium lipolyticum]|uniref:Uncharacterized protein n=1 Tax=Flavobacterium lipolyticum TaxID=2893754 RepID=A0ABS8LVA0_9FLAO|nr:hypothetical protein [Flavobacterium sp. F-126]MCC9016449.1 hypothetical protein [Flavobacterium sp. F-126]
MATNINNILSWFKTGEKPTQKQFWDSWQSFWHKEEQIPQSAISDLDSVLNAKTEKAQFDAHKTDRDAHPEIFTVKEDKTNKNQRDGYAGLDALGKLYSNQLPDPLLTLTKLEAEEYINNSKLVKGQLYEITGVDNGWCDVQLRALENNVLETNGIGKFNNPDYYSYSLWTKNMIGTFNNVVGNFVKGENVTSNNGALGKYLSYGFIEFISGNWADASSITGSESLATSDVSGFVNSPSYSINDIVIWGNNHWRNLNGNPGVYVDESSLDTSEWVIDTAAMITVYDPIRYNWEGDQIYYRENDYNNKTGNNKIGGYVKGFKWGGTITNTQIPALECYIANLNIQMSDCYFKGFSIGDSVNNLFNTLHINNINTYNFQMYGITNNTYLNIYEMNCARISFRETVFKTPFNIGSIAAPYAFSIYGVDNLKSMQNIYIQHDLHLSQLDTSNWTELFKEHPKTILNKPNGDSVITYIDNNNEQKIVALSS